MNGFDFELLAFKLANYDGRTIVVCKFEELNGNNSSKR